MKEMGKRKKTKSGGKLKGRKVSGRREEGREGGSVRNGKKCAKEKQSEQEVGTERKEVERGGKMKG